MSLLKICLASVLAVVAAVGPRNAPPMSRGPQDYSYKVPANGETLMKNKMADLTSRVARMESRGDQQRDTLEKMTKDVVAAKSSLEATFKDVSRRMDALEEKLKTGTTSHTQQDRYEENSKEVKEKEYTNGELAAQIEELVAEDARASDAYVQPSDSHTTVKPTVSHKAHTNVHPTDSHKAHTTVHPTDSHKAHTTVHPNDSHKAHTNVHPTDSHKTPTTVSPTVSQEASTTVIPSGEVEEKEYTEAEIEAKIEACGRPPMKEGQSAEVTVYEGKVQAVYSCSKQFVLIDPDSSSISYCKDGLWSPVNAFCSNLTTCGQRTFFRMEYNGTLSVTKSGKTCQRWTSETPHQHDYYKDRQFWYTTGFPAGETAEQASNYCREPGMISRVGQVWCYTTDPNTRWEECDLPECSEGK